MKSTFVFLFAFYFIAGCTKSDSSPPSSVKPNISISITYDEVDHSDTNGCYIHFGDTAIVSWQDGQTIVQKGSTIKLTFGQPTQLNAEFSEFNHCVSSDTVIRVKGSYFLRRNSRWYL